MLAVQYPELVRARSSRSIPPSCPFPGCGGGTWRKRWGWPASCPSPTGQRKDERSGRTGIPFYGLIVNKKSMQRWEETFSTPYVERGQGNVYPPGHHTWRCAPAWEARCFATCPHDVWQYVPQVRCPTLVIYGKDSDTFLKPAAERFKKKLPSAELVGMENTSHFVPMERREERRRRYLNS